MEEKVMCKNSCKECSCKIFSQSVTLATIDGTDTVVINVPQQTFKNGCRGCLVIIQSIPTNATIATPVAITIGDDATTYPLVTNCCSPVTACRLRTRTRYPFVVSTNLTGGSFKILKNLSCGPNNNLSVIPIA
jgi:hypothetical protein